MNVTISGQVPDDKETSLSSTLADFASGNQCDSVFVAVAYASVAGLLRFLKLVEAKTRPELTSHWLFGLDDYLTQPGVLRTCCSMPNAELRTAQLSKVNRRFHPKLMIVSASDSSSLACVGSGNLTLGGLERNCEAYAAISVAGEPDVSSLFTTWGSVWNVGSPTSEADIDAYEDEYNKRQPLDLNEDETESEVEEAPSKPSEILTSDSPALDPSMATTCWIEVGNNTAKGHELEFKAEQALFFGLSPSGTGTKKEYRDFIASSGETVSLALKYQTRNGMWRLQMNAGIPEVAKGLRPKGPKPGTFGRSPHVAVFSRSEARNTFFIRFILLGSDEFRQLARKSARTGTSGRTSARRYGWC